MNINKINWRTITYCILGITLIGFNIYFSKIDFPLNNLVNEVNNEIKLLNTKPYNSKIFNNKFLKIYIPSGYQLFYDNDTALKFRYNRFLIDFSIFTKPVNIDNYIKAQPEYNNEYIYSINYDNSEYKVWFKLISNNITEINLYNDNLELKTLVPNYMLKIIILKNIELMKNSTIIATGERLLVLDDDELSQDKSAALEDDTNSEDIKNKNKCNIDNEQNINIS